MTASTMPHHTARHTAARPIGRPHAHRAGGTAADVRQEPLSAVSLELECEDGCHYCHGPETD